MARVTIFSDSQRPFGPSNGGIGSEFGDTWDEAVQKINAMFTEIYTVGTAVLSYSGGLQILGSDVSIADGGVTNAKLANPQIVLGSTPLTLGGTYNLINGSLTFGGTVNFSGSLEIGGTAVTLPVSVPNGGTGAATFTGNGVLYGSGTSALGVTGVNNTATNKFLTQINGFAPAWATIQSSDLPAPTTSLIGGVKAINAVSHEWINAIDLTGTPQLSQPAFNDLSGNIAIAQMNSGTGASASTFWRGDNTWAALPGGFTGFAAPANLVGLTSSAGTATTALHSDVTLALDQSIAPTWTGLHTFNAAVAIKAALTAYVANGWGYVAPGVNNVVGNGIADDTTAIQAIWTANNNVAIGPGTFLISATLLKNLTSIGHCRIIGSGAYYSHFVAKSTFTGTPAIQITIPNGVANDYEIGGFSIVNQTAGSGASYGLMVAGTGTAGGNTKSHVFDVVSSGFGFNFVQQSTRMVVWDRCAAWNLDNSNASTSGEFGWYLYTAANGDFCGDSDFVACQAVSSATGVCGVITDQGATSARLNGIRFRGHTFYNKFVGLHTDLTGANSVSFDIWVNPGCQFDGTVTSACISLEANAAGTGIGDYNINGTYFSTANVGSHIVGRVTNGGKFNGLSICGNWLINNSGASVDIRGTNGTANGIVFCNNRNEGVDCPGTVVNYFENVGNVTAVGNTGFNTVSGGTVYVEVNNPSAGDYATVIGNNSGGCAATAQSVSGGAQLTHTQVSGNQ